MTDKHTMHLETVRTILIDSNALDLDDDDSPFCDNAKCHRCPNYSISNEGFCKFVDLRNWWRKHVTEKGTL